MQTPMEPEVLVEHDNGLVIVTINRPTQRNAVNRAVSYGVCEALDEMDRRPDLHVGILPGAGGYFCAGPVPKSRDAREGSAAFAERREAVWTGE